MNQPRQYQLPRISEISHRLRALHLPQRVRIMEVCGGHTAAIYRHGLPDLLSEQIELLSGPGCPVCVTPISFVDHAVALAKRDDITIALFGDLLRVPGSQGSLAAARAEGADVRVVYSSMECLQIAAQNPSRTVVFLGIGFETTACTIAATMSEAAKRGVPNFKLLSALKTMPEALRTLFSSTETQVDGLILPGHVCTVVGSRPFEFLSHEYKVPCAVSGFEPLDIMDSVEAIVTQLIHQHARVENRYPRAVRDYGNVSAQQMMSRIFRPADMEWRGLGTIKHSGLLLRPEIKEWDAATLGVALPQGKEHPACRCGEVLRGAIRPEQCKLLGKVCTPDSPVGACMVSSEGACAAVYEFQVVHAG